MFLQSTLINSNMLVCISFLLRNEIITSHTSFPELVESGTYKYVHILSTLEQILVQAQHVFLEENTSMNSLLLATIKYYKNIINLNMLDGIVWVLAVATVGNV